jgi:hypothetical protein
MSNQSSSNRIAWFLILLLIIVLAATACNGRVSSRRSEPLPTLASQAEPPTATSPALIPATFTPPAQPTVNEVESETGTAVEQAPQAPATNTAVLAPTQEPAPALSAETEQLFTELDSLINQIDQIDNDDLSDLP